MDHEIETAETAEMGGNMTHIPPMGGLIRAALYAGPVELLVALILVIAACIVVAATRKEPRAETPEEAEEREWMDAIR